MEWRTGRHSAHDKQYDEYLAVCTAYVMTHDRLLVSASERMKDFGPLEQILSLSPAYYLTRVFFQRSDLSGPLQRLWEEGQPSDAAFVAGVVSHSGHDGPGLSEFRKRGGSLVADGQR